MGKPNHVPGLYRRPNGFWWWQPPMRAGMRPSAIALGTRDRDAAMLQVLDLRQRDATYRNPGRLSFQITRYLDAQGHYTAATRATCGSCLGLFCGFLSDPMVSSINQQAVERWLDSLAVGETTKLGYMMKLRAFLAWLVRDGQLQRNPMAKVKVAQMRATRVARYCTPAQREALLAAAPNERIRFVLWMGFFAGLRVGEIAECRPDWIRLRKGGGEVVVQRTDTFVPKDKDARSIPVSPRLRKYLAGLLPMDPAGVYMLPGRNRGRIRYDPSKRLKEIGTLHALAGTPLHLIARWLGDDIRVVHRHYLGFSTGDAHAASID